jgi:hypothetical protein
LAATDTVQMSYVDDGTAQGKNNAPPTTNLFLFQPLFVLILDFSNTTTRPSTIDHTTQDIRCTTPP